MSCWFQHCLGTVKALFTEWCSEARSFRRLSNQLFRSIYVRKDNSIFQHCLGTVKALFTEWCSEARSFRRLSNQLFRSIYVRKIVRLRHSTLYSKCSKFHAHFRTAIKNSENVFCFRDNRVWICVKMCKLQREYLLSAVNDLKNSLKITNQNKKDFFQFNISLVHGKIR